MTFVPYAPGVFQGATLANPSLLLAPAGCLGETFPRSQCAGAASSMSSADAWFSAIGLTAGIVVTDITLIVGNTAQISGTHGWFGICDKNYKLLAVSADQTSTFLTPNNTPVTLAMVKPYTIPVTDRYYLIFSQVDTSTAPNAGAASILAGVASAAPLLSGFITGQSTPPAVGATLTTPTGTGSRLYGYVS